MLKIPKGLKKKKKGKKSKRKGEEELFTEEELEKYRREHQAQPQPQPSSEVQQDSDQEQSDKPKPDTDEWSKFNALTTGVDSILKKTQGDLDRIKSTSFFQRVPAGPKTVDRCGKDLPFKRDSQKDGQRWIGFEEKKENNQESEPQPETTKVEQVPQAPAQFVVSESESEEEDFDDIFDTSYVEAVEKGEVKLAYIPDSPEEDFDEGPDPFDTSYADKVIKGPEVSKKGKKLVNIGVAVEVLTGRLDSVNTNAAAVKKAKRRIPQDLLLESGNSEDNVDLSVEEPIKATSLLDDDSGNLDDVPVDLSVSLHTQFIKHEETENAEDKNKDILNTFDTVYKSEEDEDDEFAKLASESLSKPVDVVHAPSLPAEPVIEETSWAAFEDTKSKPSRPPPPRPLTGPNQTKTDSDLALTPSSLDDENDGPDPFDTTFAENILPGKVELKNLEEELLNSNNTELTKSDSDFDFNPREGERAYINNRRKSSVHIHITDPLGIRESISDFDSGDVENFDTLKPVHRDLLGGSSTDLSQLADSPIAPSATTDGEVLEYSDPFDTSIVNLISAPGKTELKFIEKELLGETEIKRSLSDPDFDPRADEIEEKYKNAPRKASRPENLLVNKTVLFKIPADGQNFLDTEKDNKKKPVTPYYAREASITDEDVDTLEDTFDTSCGPSTFSQGQPNQSILKKGIDSVGVHLVRSTSDQDLNADEEEEYTGKSFSQLRRHSDFPVNFTKTIDFANLGKKNLTRGPDFLSISEEESVDTKVLTPFQESKGSIDLDIDPFDTSIVSNILLPGKTELKVLESELLSKESNDLDFDPRAEEKRNPGEVDLLAPSDDAFQVKALTPEIPDPVTGFLIGTEDDDIDPFDTSIAENLVPGKTELKLLESELMN